MYIDDLDRCATSAKLTANDNATYSKRNYDDEKHAGHNNATGISLIALYYYIIYYICVLDVTHLL